MDEDDFEIMEDFELFEVSLFDNEVFVDDFYSD